MEISRRRLLGLGACVAASWATSSCRSTTDGAATPTSPVPGPAAVTPTAEPSRTPRVFPGQPPPGKLYYGATVTYDVDLEVWERQLGSRLSLHRSYFVPDATGTADLLAQCREDVRRRRLPHVSIKPLGTWGDVASGRRDTWLAQLLDPLGEMDTPVFFTVHHEPENDTGGVGMQAADFVRMQQRVIRLAAELAPQVTVVPILQHWTFEPVRHGIDPAAWLVPEASVAGLDVYNHWSPRNRKDWRSFGSKIDEALPWLEEKPIVIGEYGCRSDPHYPGLAARWLRDAVAYARTHDIIAMSYFNSPVGATDGSWEMTAAMEKEFARLLGSDWVARSR